MKTDRRLLEKCQPVAEPVEAEAKTVEGQTFRMELQPKGAKCCEGCEIPQYHFECSQFSECTNNRNLDKVWVSMPPAPCQIVNRK